jgi:hypothetical protein
MCRGARHRPGPHHRNRPIPARMEVPHVFEEETDPERQASCRQPGERQSLARASHCRGGSDCRRRAAGIALDAERDLEGDDRHGGDPGGRFCGLANRLLAGGGT